MKQFFSRIYLLTITLLILITAPVHAGFKWPYVAQAVSQKQDFNLSNSTHLPQTLSFVQNNYVEPERIDPKEMLKESMNDIQKVVPEILVKFDSPTSIKMIIDKAEKKFSSPLNKLSDLWKMIQEIFAFIEMNYKGEIELKDIESLAINGALKTLDPHSNFLSPEFYKEFKIDTGGEFGGLGIVVTSKDGQLTVIAPIEDTPAWKSGIKTGDIITQINDLSTINMSLMEAVEKLRGKVGSKVTLTVERKGRATPIEISMTRANIHIDSIKATLIKDGNDDVGYIKIKRFQKDTAKDFAKQLKQLETESGNKFKGLIIDLTNNPGGLLDEAIEIADTFLTNGVIVSTVGANKRFIDEESAHVAGTEPDTYPIIVIVNEGSASASEIVAGALQSYDRAMILGQRTFGKGSVQSVYDLGNDYALKLTIAQYLTAGTNSIQTIGISPDIAVVPMIVDKKSMDIIPNKPSSEMELEKHLNQIAPITGKENLVIGYYKPYVDEEKLIEEMRDKEYQKDLDFKNDFAVKLATKIIMASRTPRTSGMLKDASTVISKLRDQEEEKISAKLHELGTDWSIEADSQPTFSVQTSTKQKGIVVDRAVTGEDLQMVLTVTNNGKKPLSRLLGVIDSENPFIGEKEFIFGRVMPGQSISREVTTKIPVSFNTMDIPYKVNFKQNDKPVDMKFSSKLKIVELPKPAFSLNFQLEKPLTVTAISPLPRGKSVPLTVKIKNVGTGPTKDLKAYISNKKNEKAIFIDQGRANLGIVKPGEIKKATFAFKVQPEMKNSTFPLELTIMDREFLEFSTINIDITMESGATRPQSGVWYEGPQITLAEKTFPVTTDKTEYSVVGKITDSVPIKEYYIFVNEEKGAYESNPEEATSMDINATIKLKDGVNNINIFAKNINKITTRRSFVIEKGALK